MAIAGGAIIEKNGKLLEYDAGSPYQQENGSHAARDLCSTGDSDYQCGHLTCPWLSSRPTPGTSPGGQVPSTTDLILGSGGAIRKENLLKTIIVANRDVTPTKIVCVGRNYLEHIAELNNEIPDEPVFFSKPNSAISKTLHAFHQEPLHYEGELSFVYEDGRFCAVGFGLDITKRMLQNKLKAKGLPWERCKAFDGSATFSPFVEIAAVSPHLGLALSINGEMVQSGSIDMMMYPPDDILERLSRFMSLENGDIVMTGTPKGVGEIKSGDVFCGKVLDNGVTLTTGEWVAV